MSVIDTDTTVVARMSESSWYIIKWPRPITHHPLSLYSLCSQGVITAAKELDYEISHGRYTLIVTATDQCPILSYRLTSTTTVCRGNTSPMWRVREHREDPGGSMVEGEGKEMPVGRKCLNVSAPVHLCSSSRLAVLL